MPRRCCWSSSTAPVRKRWRRTRTRSPASCARTARADQASGEIMAVCIAAGGTITGEHGIGLDKLRYMPLIFDGDALAAMRAVRLVFDPLERVNPGKVVPVHACREWTGRWNAERGTRNARSDVRSDFRVPTSALET